MNKQELIKEFEEIGIHGLNMFGAVVKGIPTKTAIDLIKQLDEPEKVKVPQFVADWIEECKAKEKSLLKSLLYTPEGVNSWVDNSENQEAFAKAWLFGYEVEEEKRYTVKIKGNIKENMLVYGELLERYFFTKSFSLDNAIYSHTRKELEEAGFGWVFDCEGIEVEEVE